MVVGAAYGEAVCDGSVFAAFSGAEAGNATPAPAVAGVLRTAVGVGAGAMAALAAAGMHGAGRTDGTVSAVSAEPVIGEV